MSALSPESSDSPDQPRFRRRDFLKIPILAVAAYSVAKIASRLTVGAGLGASKSAVHLSDRQCETIRAASGLIVGPEGASALAAGEWDPVQYADDLLGAMSPGQRRMAGVGLYLFEEWTVGLVGFTDKSADVQQNWLRSWATSENGVKASVWGLLHAIASASYSSSEVGWRQMKYPGPCRSDVGYAGRNPGQSQPVHWHTDVP